MNFAWHVDTTTEWMLLALGAAIGFALFLAAFAWASYTVGQAIATKLNEEAGPDGR